ncbi:unnamed protein product [Amoebophrya sp. A25]|nr:unnamed protein product [Amoebophrya sp. A25]|eukprot:GSA25T00024670001.1
MLSSQWDNLTCTVAKNLNDLFSLWLHHALHDPSHTFFHGDPHADNIKVHVGDGLSSSASSTTSPESATTNAAASSSGSASSGRAGPCLSGLVRGIAQSCSPAEHGRATPSEGHHPATTSNSNRSVVDLDGALMNELPYRASVETLEAEIKSVAIPKDVGHLTLIDFGIIFMSEEKQPLFVIFRRFTAAVYFGSIIELRRAFGELPADDPFILAFEAEWPRLAALPLEQRMRAVATELLIPELPRLPAPQGMHEFLFAFNPLTDVFAMFVEQKAPVLATCVPQSDHFFSASSLPIPRPSSSSAVDMLSSYVRRGTTRGEEPEPGSLLKSPLREVLEDVISDYTYDAVGNLISSTRKKLRI